MKRYRVVYLDAFTAEPFAGNPCAVLPEADGLSERQMQRIASETNLSETAFVFRSEIADVKVRYFTPRIEVAFAGHPTIATAMLLAQDKKLFRTRQVNVIDFEFNIGVLPVEIKMDSAGKPFAAVMTQQKPIFGRTLDTEKLAACLGLDRDDFTAGSPVQIISTGVPFLMAPVNTMAILKQARVDRSLLQSMLERIGVDAVYLFCLEGFEPGTDAHARLLTSAPGSEDPFTGSAAGCLGAYAVHHGLHPGPVLKVEQGHLLGRPGTATVEIVGTGDEIKAVKVGGCAVKTMDGVIFVDD